MYENTYENNLIRTEVKLFDNFNSVLRILRDHGFDKIEIWNNFHWKQWPKTGKKYYTTLNISVANYFEWWCWKDFTTTLYNIEVHFLPENNFKLMVTIYYSLRTDLFWTHLYAPGLYSEFIVLVVIEFLLRYKLWAYT